MGNLRPHRRARQAGTFTAIRIFLELPLVALWLSLFTRFGRRYPELIMVALLVLIQSAIAYMLSRITDAYAPYTLGMSLASTRARSCSWCPGRTPRL